MGLQTSAQHYKETETQTSVAWIDSFDCLKFINGIEGNRIVEDSWFYHPVALKCMWLGIRDSFLFAFSQGLHLRKMGAWRKDVMWGEEILYGAWRDSQKRGEWKLRLSSLQTSETETSQKVGNKHALVRDNGRNIFHKDWDYPAENKSCLVTGMRGAEGKGSPCEDMVGMRVMLTDPCIAIMSHPEFYFYHFSVKFYSLSKDTQL